MLFTNSIRKEHTSPQNVLNHALFCHRYRYFNYRTTRFLTEEGFYQFHNWFDDRAWYPLGRIIGGTIYPGKKGLIILLVTNPSVTGLMVTSAGIYHVLHALNITIEIRNVCVFLAPLFSSLTVIATYHLTKELKVTDCTWVHVHVYL